MGVYKTLPFAIALVMGSIPLALADTEKANRLKTVKVTATAETTAYTPESVTLGKTGQSLKEIPQSVSIISHQRIEDQNLDDIIDVLGNTTGVTSTQSDSERTEFYARGFYIDSYQFDGLPTQMVQNWSYGDSGLDLALYDRVEVVRGATGLLTGAGNPSASVNLIRKHADSAELTGNVSVTTTSLIREFFSRSTAGPESTAWVATTITSAAPASKSASACLPESQAKSSSKRASKEARALSGRWCITSA